MGSKFGFGKVADALAVQIKLAAVDIMAETKRYFGEAFDKEQLGKQKWDDVARRTPGNIFYENQVVYGKNKPSGKTFRRDQGSDWRSRKILAGETGRLRYKTVKADSSITNAGATSVMFNPVPYAGYVNDGTPYMKARPFMKQTEELTTIQLNILNVVTGKIWKVQP
jgi:hypothetical protein